MRPREVALRPALLVVLVGGVVERVLLRRTASSTPCHVYYIYIYIISLSLSLSLYIYRERDVCVCMCMLYIYIYIYTPFVKLHLVISYYIVRLCHTISCHTVSYHVPYRSVFRTRPGRKRGAGRAGLAMT